MPILLDTHLLLWAATDSARLPEPMHPDPFDRILLAHEWDEGWELGSADARLCGFGHVLDLR